VTWGDCVGPEFGRSITGMGRHCRQPRALGACILFTTLLLSEAAMAASYPFDDSGYLGPATLMPDWRDTLERQGAQSHVLEACLARQECPPAYHGLRLLLTKASALPEERQIHLINHYVNRKRYTVDRPRELDTELSADPVKYRSRWSTVAEFVARGGDCEDYATTKYFLLRQLGLPAERLRVVVVFDRKSRGHHAVLALQHPDGNVWLLDSDSVIRTSRRHGYRFVYSVNETSVWDHEATRDVPGMPIQEKEAST